MTASGRAMHPNATAGEPTGPRRLRIAIVQETVDATRGGAETSTLEMAEALTRQGLDVTIICRGEKGAKFAAGSVNFLPIPTRGWPKLWRTFRFIQGVHRVCRIQRFDVVHAVTPCLNAHIYQPRGGTYKETVARTLAITDDPFWRAVKRLARLFNLRQRFLLHIETALLRKRAARVTVAALSDYVRRQVIEGYGFPPERVRVIFNGVSVASLSDPEIAEQRTRRREELGLPADTPLLLFVAHNFRLKGLRELLWALLLAEKLDREFAACRSQLSAAESARLTELTGCHLVVVGRDKAGRYRRAARRAGLARRVHFVGTQRPIREWYAAADVLAHPTWYDPCSRVVLEALSVGLPVVTTRWNGAAEVMDEGRHGSVIDTPDDLRRLGVAICASLAPEVRSACRADAERMRAAVSMERHAADLAALYKRIAPRAPAGSS